MTIIQRDNVGNEVSMTFPESLNHTLRINGRRVSLPRKAHQVAEMLMLRRDWVWRDELMEYMYPDPDDMALTWGNLLSRCVRQLREIGFPLETYHGWGMRLAEPDQPAPLLFTED